MAGDKDKEYIEKMTELASAHAYLTIALRCIDNARLHLKYTDMRVEEKSLTNMYDVLNAMLLDLRDEWEKEE